MANNSAFSFDLPIPQNYQNKPIEMWMRVLSTPKGKIVNININQSNFPTHYSLNILNFLLSRYLMENLLIINNLIISQLQI